MGHGRAETVGFWDRVFTENPIQKNLVALLLLAGCVCWLNGCAAGVTASSKQTPAQASFQLSSTSVTFGNVTVGKAATQTVSMVNSGNVALNITQVSVSNPQFTVSGITTPAALGVGQTISFTVAVNANAAGTVTGTLTVTGDSGSSPAAASLTATAVAAGQPKLSVGPSAIDFGSVLVGSKGTTNLVLTNAGNANLTVSSLTVAGTDFTINGISMPQTIGGGQSVQATVTFTPTAAGSVSGSVSIVSNDPTNPTQTLSLSGTGSAASKPSLSVTPSSANFGDVTVGAPSTQTFQLKNSGTGTLSITQVNVTGSGFSSGSLSLPVSLGTGQSSSFNVQFSPSASGAVTGSVSVVSNASNSPVTIALSGTGVAATRTLSFSTTSLPFGNVNAGSSASLPVKVTNTGNSSVQISGITESGTGFALSGASTPVTLSPNQSLMFNVSFSPIAAGADNGSVTVTSNASSSPVTISLSGMGVQATSHSVALNWIASSSPVTGYNVYRSTTSGSNYTKVNGSLVSTVNYTDSTVQNGTTYYYVTTAVDASGNESTYSNQASAAIP
jgi:hypothetical protein